jgi:hypothetical protein
VFHARAGFRRGAQILDSPYGGRPAAYRRNALVAVRRRRLPRNPGQWKFTLEQLQFQGCWRWCRNSRRLYRMVFNLYAIGRLYP